METKLAKLDARKAAAEAGQRAALAQSRHLESWPPGQDWAKRYIRVWTWYRHVCTCSDCFIKSWRCMYMYVLEHKYIQLVLNINIYKYLNINIYKHICSWFNIFVCKLYILCCVHTYLFVYVYMLIYVWTQYRLHFPSGPISLATLASLSSTQEPLLLSSLLPVPYNRI
jgi:hypothetical protein